METLYRLERLNSVTNTWEFARFVKNKNYPCCSTSERIV